MKLSSALLFTGILFTSVTLVSCGYGKLKTNAEEGGTAFYTDLQKQNYSSALALCSKHAFTTDSKGSWDSAFKRNAGLLGELKSFTKTGGPVLRETSDLGTTVVMTYDVQWQYGKTNDSLIFVKGENGTAKLSHYFWYYKDASFLTETEQSEKAADRYMQAVKSNDFITATNFCSDAALAVTPKPEWVLFLEEASNHWGAMSAYKIIGDSTRYHIASTGVAGTGNYYDVVVQSQRGDSKVMEKMTFFQKTYNEPMKLTGHWFL